MTKIFIACKDCIPAKVMPHIQERKFPFSQGQTDIWTCIHVITYRATYPETFEKIDK